ncbi:anthranilate synthase component I family protein [Metabacillus sp. GX 13764]|uniref:anthranilate synthase component I family protein n=1 Tax=Metabacillus kandeliae TaxID=2900151 RepID=UPI001E2C9E80|nr:anthranilate synthase component I family protein [Metabacillus kandeliae]MCD7036667.1 anthranilate synthase component I family protein [Metabacillus kandeliae]
MKPLFIQIPFTGSFFQRYETLARQKSRHIILESGKGGRYSMAGIDPIAVVSAKDETLTIQEGGRIQSLKGEPLALFKDWFKQLHRPLLNELPDYQGGAIGFISYDAVRRFEKLPSIAADDLDTPDFYFMIFNETAVYDHLEEVLWLIVQPEKGESEDSALKRLQNLKERWTNNDAAEEPVSQTEEARLEKGHFTEEAFKEAAEKIKQYIADGDVFQVNLSVRQAMPLTTQPLDIYKSLRRVNPSPYMAYLHAPEFQIVCGSPELLVKKKGSSASTRPIAGTRSRGLTEAEDRGLADELIGNEKERAEHVMLVDLERNDLGRICEYGTVEVDEFMAVEKYSHVMHIVSNVRGTLRQDVELDDIIKAVFPGGTITGAPKIRTMEIIEELEPARRGIYTGSIGWIDFSGDMELNIVIRTLFAKDGSGYIQAGAGIVIDSNPKHEYKESLKKAMAMKKAVELSKEEQIIR